MLEHNSERIVKRLTEFLVSSFVLPGSTARTLVEPHQFIPEYPGVDAYQNAQAKTQRLLAMAPVILGDNIAAEE